MKKCLIIDDQKVNRLLLSKLIKKLGFDFHDTDNVFEAMRLILNNNFTVILIDWYMYEIDGPKLIKIIRGTPEGKQKVIFLYSAIENLETGLIKAVDVGADGFIAKPVTKEEIIRQFGRINLL